VQLILYYFIAQLLDLGLIAVRVRRAPLRETFRH
jgi:hypothetical protein